MTTDERVEDSGTLEREGGGFVLRRDSGGSMALDFGRMPVDLVGKHVRIIGLRAADGRIEVEGIRPGD